MRTFLSVILAGVAGSVVAGVSSGLVIGMKGPTFAWEMAGGVLLIVSTIVGGVAGSGGAAVCELMSLAGRPFTRACVGLGIGFVLGFVVGCFVIANSSANHPRAPEGIMFWGTAVVVIGGSLAGMVGGLLAIQIKSK